MGENDESRHHSNKESVPIPVDRLGRNTDRLRRLAVRFKDVNSLERVNSSTLAKGVMFIPDKNLSQVGTQVELTVSLPVCHRLIQVPAVVKACLKAGSGRTPGMLLGFGKNTSKLQNLISSFLNGCRGATCGIEGELALSKCDLSERAERKSSTSGVIVVPLGEAKPMPSPASKKEVRVDSIPNVRPDLLSPEKRTTLVGMQSAPGKPGIVRAPDLPPPPSDDDVIDSKPKEAELPRRRRPSLLNIPLFGKKHSREERKDHGERRSRQGPRLAGSGKEKAALIIRQAEDAVSADNLEKAITLLKMAVAFDPENEEAKRMLEDVQAQYKPTFKL